MADELFCTEYKNDKNLIINKIEIKNEAKLIENNSNEENAKKEFSIFKLLSPIKRRELNKEKDEKNIKLINNYSSPSPKPSSSSLKPSSSTNNNQQNSTKQCFPQKITEFPITTQQQIQLDLAIAQRLLFNYQNNNLIQEGENGGGGIALRLAAVFAAASSATGGNLIKENFSNNNIIIPNISTSAFDFTQSGCSSKSYRRRKARTVFSDQQLQGLEQRFNSQKYLSTPERINLADSLHLSETQASFKLLL